MPNGHEVVEQMTAAGWARTGDVTFEVQLATWADAREPLATAMNAALAPFMPYWLGGFDSATHAAEADPQRVAQLRLIFDAWAQESQPEWWEERASCGQLIQAEDPAHGTYVRVRVQTSPRSHRRSLRGGYSPALGATSL